METNLENTCDIILKHCLENNGLFNYRGTKEDALLGATLQFKAINQLAGENPPLLRQRTTSQYYDLTLEGHLFAESGGYSGKRQREEEAKIKYEINENERIIKEQKQQLLIDKQIQDLENRLSVFEEDRASQAKDGKINRALAIIANIIAFASLLVATLAIFS